MQLMAASTGVALTGSEFLAQTAARATTTLSPNGSNGIEHVVVLMMENRSFDHFLGWLPGADGRHDMTYLSTDGNVYPNYPLAPDFQGCGYSDPDHSWEGFLVQHNFGKMDGFLQRPTAPADNPGVTLAAANTFPIGYYTNLHHDRTPQGGARPTGHRGAGRELHGPRPLLLLVCRRDLPEPLLPARGPDRPGPQHVTISTLPTIWDQLSPIPNTQGIPTGGYFFRDLPFLALWGTKYFPFWHPFAAGDTDALGIPVTTPSFIDTVAQGLLPNVSFVDPAFDTESNGTSADDHPWRTSGSASGSSPTPTTPWTTPATWTTPCSWSPSTSGAASSITCRRRRSSTTPTRRRRSHRGQHHPHRRPAGAGLPATRVPGAGHRGLQPRPPPGRAPWPVRAHVHAEADRDDLRAEPAHRHATLTPRTWARSLTGPGARCRPAPSRPAARCSGRPTTPRHLQRQQRAVGLSDPGAGRRASRVPAPVLAVGVADGFGDGRVRRAFPEGARSVTSARATKQSR